MRDIICVFAACAVPIHSWSTLIFFNQMPGWLVYLSTWDLVGTFAYTQTFALVECLTLALLVILLATILPAQVLRNRFVAKTSLLVLLILAWAAAAQLTGIKPWKAAQPFLSKRFWVGGVLFLASIGGTLFLVDRYQRAEAAVKSLAERLVVLLYLHVPIALSSLAIVIVRNVQRGVR